MPFNSMGLLFIFLESNYNRVIHIIIKDNSIPLRIVKMDSKILNPITKVLLFVNPDFYWRG